jgi:hypothetical protein
MQANHFEGNSRAFAIICVSAFYVLSMILPARLSEGFWEDKEPVGAQAFLRAIQTIFDERGSFWYGVWAMMPNVLVWFGVACLWWKMPCLSLLAGFIATVIAAGFIWQVVSFISQIADKAIATEQCGFMQNLGVWTWLMSMATLSICGFWLCKIRRNQDEAAPR